MILGMIKGDKIDRWYLHKESDERCALLGLMCATNSYRTIQIQIRRG